MRLFGFGKRKTAEGEPEVGAAVESVPTSEPDPVP